VSTQHDNRLNRHTHSHSNAEYLKFPDLFNPEAQFLDNAVSYQTEEDAVGERLACGIITITSNI
jgi:hypothetical protein